MTPTGEVEATNESFAVWSTREAPVEPSAVCAAIWACVESWEMPFTDKEAFGAPATELSSRIPLKRNSAPPHLFVRSLSSR